MTIKTHQNYSGLSYLQYKHRVKKLENFIDQVKSYGRSKFRKNEVFVSKSVTALVLALALALYISILLDIALL